MELVLAKDEKPLSNGLWVQLRGHGERNYLIESHEEQQGLLFYRLKGIEGGLFVRSSLERQDDK